MSSSITIRTGAAIGTMMLALALASLPANADRQTKSSIDELALKVKGWHCDG